MKKRRIRLSAYVGNQMCIKKMRCANCAAIHSWKPCYFDFGPTAMPCPFTDLHDLKKKDKVPVYCHGA